MKVIVIVLDSVGVGEAPDAVDYGDVGSATLPHTAAAVGGIELPTFASLGLGNVPSLLLSGKPIIGVEPTACPLASWGAMRELSEGKDTVTGHWEIAGLHMRPGFSLFPHDAPSFPADLMYAFAQRTGRSCIGNKAAGGTQIIDELGPQHLQSGEWIVYTSADSVFQLCAHEKVVPIDEMYKACEIARELCNPYRIGRVIARPFVGEPGSFTRTENRRDYVFKPSEPTILERLFDAGVAVYAVGKIEDIYAHRGITESIHSGNNLASQEAVELFLAKPGDGLIFANFIDFDMLYGHRRDAPGYAACLEQTDQWLAGFLPKLDEEDLLIITADHGNDPTFAGTDHTREYVPLLVYRKGQAGGSLGIREGFFDVAQSLASCFSIPPTPRGTSFLSP